MRYFYGLNRTLCDVLNAMRKCDKTKNYSILLSLVEEAQLMGERMEAALADSKDLSEIQKEIKDKKKQLKKLEAKLEKEKQDV